MQVESFYYRKEKGWSTNQFPLLDSPNTVVFIFGAPKYFEQPDTILSLLHAYPKAHKIGCSTAGEVCGDRVFDESISVAVARFEKTAIRSASAKLTSSLDSFTAGQELAKQLEGDELCGVFVLSEGLKVNGSELTRGLHSVIPNAIPITGGLAGDGDKFNKTYTIDNEGKQDGSIRAIGFYGKNLQFAHGSQGGWDIFGPERHVTKSEGNILYELDGRPALELYKEYLGEKAKELPSSALLFPLSIRTGEDESHRIVRTILGVDEERQALIFAGDIPKGCHAQLMRANFDRLIDGAHQAASSLLKVAAAQGPILSIAISCVGRKLVLGQRVEEEVDATFSIFPKNVCQIGFYSYGEISPYHYGEECELHNQTMTLTAFSEK